MKKLTFLLTFLLIAINLFSQDLFFRVTDVDGLPVEYIGKSLKFKYDGQSTSYNHGQMIISGESPEITKDVFWKKSDTSDIDFYFFIRDANTQLSKISFDEKKGKFLLISGKAKFELELVYKSLQGATTVLLERSNVPDVIAAMFGIEGRGFVFELESFTTSAMQKSIFDELEADGSGLLFVNIQKNTIDFYSTANKFRKKISTKYIIKEGSLKGGDLSLIMDCNYKNTNEKWNIKLIKSGDKLVGTIKTSSELETKLVELGQLNFIKKSIDFKPLSSDTINPEVKIFRPRIDRDLVIKSKNKKLVVEGWVGDNSQIGYFNINDVETNLVEGKFLAPVEIVDNRVRLVAVDIWGNKSIRQWEVTPEMLDEKGEEPSLDNIGNYFALIIGVNNYADKRIPQLDNPIKDGKTLKNILINNYTFEPNNITVLENPDRKAIFRALQDVKSLVGKNDNLLLFYAGHGYFDKEMDSGYWLPSDSEKDNKSDWISFDDVLNHIRAISSKHTLVISDACFSGGFLKERNVTLTDKAMQDLYQVPSRKVITSGNLTTVPDESVFMRYLVKALSENKDKYFTEENLFDRIKIPVLNNSETTPLIGVLSRTGDEGGNFIFIKR